MQQNSYQHSCPIVLPTTLVPLLEIVDNLGILCYDI